MRVHHYGMAPDNEYSALARDGLVVMLSAMTEAEDVLGWLDSVADMELA